MTAVIFDPAAASLAGEPLSGKGFSRDRKDQLSADDLSDVASETDTIVGGGTETCGEKKFKTHNANPLMDSAVRERAVKTVGRALHATLRSPEFLDPYGDSNSFFVCDLGEVSRLYRHWRRKLPLVAPHYAVKCNPNPEIVRLLARLGAGFDCASRGEMEAVLAVGVEPARVVFSNPCKFNSHLKYARDHGIDLTVFDNEDELDKIARVHPHCRALLRIETDDRDAVVRLSTKYGARPAAVDSLLARAKDLGINLAGVHFHCGAGSEEVGSIRKAVRDAKDIFTKAARMGFSGMDVLDIGGGFMINNNFGRVADAVNAALEEHFPPEMGVRVISEPGRYFATTAFTLASSVIGKRGSFGDGKGGAAAANSNIVAAPMVYINDGIYANMNCIINDHYTPVPKVLVHRGAFTYDAEMAADPDNTGVAKHKVEVWGQTCDSMDVVTKDAAVNYPVATNDWLFFRDMGAYTLAAATSFNGFSHRTRVIYVSSEEPN